MFDGAKLEAGAERAASGPESDHRTCRTRVEAMCQSSSRFRARAYIWNPESSSKLCGYVNTIYAKVVMS